MITQADKEQLCFPEIMRSYCDKELGQSKKKGNARLYRCPYGTHEKLKLEVSVKDGKGVCYCHVCQRGGKVFDIAAALNGLQLPKQFPEAVKIVAEAVGFTLTNEPRVKRLYIKPLPSLATPAAPPVQDVVEPLAPEDIALAWEAIRRASASPEVLAEHEAVLELPEGLLATHAAFSEHGRIGLSPDNRLLYIYTHTDKEGVEQIDAVKLRGRAGAHNSFLKIKGGAWESKGSMNATQERGEIRFLFCLGKPLLPWGVDAIASHDYIIITEGESDKLALDEAFSVFRDAWQGGLDDAAQYIDEHEIPAVIALSGANNFKPHWAALLKGKAIILAMDSDTAGRTAAAKLARALYSQGCRTVYLWTPPEGLKDARQTLSEIGAYALANDVLDRKEKMNHATQEEG